MDREQPRRWHGAVITLHWIGATLVLGMLMLGYSMTRLIDGPGLRFDAYQLHKSFGFCVLAVTLLRLPVRLLTGRPAWPPHMPRWQRRLAAGTQGALYLLILTMIGAGWLRVSTSPLPLPTRFFGLFTIPDIAARGAALSQAAATVHATAAKLLIALLVLHVAGALRHVLAPDGQLPGRMLPFKRRPGRINETEPPAESGGNVRGMP